MGQDAIDAGLLKDARIPIHETIVKYTMEKITVELLAKDGDVSMIDLIQQSRKAGMDVPHREQAQQGDAEDGPKFMTPEHADWQLSQADASLVEREGDQYWATKKNIGGVQYVTDAMIGSWDGRYGL